MVVRNYNLSNSHGIIHHSHKDRSACSPSPGHTYYQHYQGISYSPYQNTHNFLQYQHSAALPFVHLSHSQNMTICQRHRLLAALLIGAIAVVLLTQNKLANRVLSARNELNQTVLPMSPFYSGLLSLSQTTKTLQFELAQHPFGSSDFEQPEKVATPELAPRAGTVLFKSTNNTIKLPKGHRNLLEEARIKQEIEGEQMDPRLSYFMKVIDTAELDPNSAKAKDLNWEGYNYADGKNCMLCSYLFGSQSLSP